MTTTSSENAVLGDTGSADLHLGRDVVRRMRLPGPPLGRPLPSRIGSLASSVSRFAAATSRPIDVRRALIGPDPRGLGASSAPPRWWTPVAPTADTPAASAPDDASAPVRRSADSAAPTPAPAWLAPARPVAIRRLPERSLPRAAREVPNESTWTPGGIVGGLRGEVARVRRLDEVAAVGPMLTQNDRAKLNAGLAARGARQAAAQQAVTQQAVAQQAAAQPTVARRATTRTPRQPASAAPAPSAAEPPTAPVATVTPPTSAAPSSPARGAQAAVPSATPVGGTPPTGSSPSTASPRAAAPGPAAPSAASPSPASPSPAQATVPGATSVAGIPPTSPSSPGPASSGPPSSGPASPAQATVPGASSVAATAPGAPDSPAPALRRVARPSWQLRSQQSRFSGLLRRTPIGHGPAPSASASSTVPGGTTAAASEPIGLASVVSRLAVPERSRPTGSAGSSLESGMRSTDVVTAAGPSLIASSVDAPATVRRHAWSAGSLVMRQAADARGQAGTLGAARAAATSPAPVAAHRAAAAPPLTASQAPPASVVAAPAPSAAADTTSSPGQAAATRPAARSTDPVVRRLPSSVGTSPVTAPASIPAGGEPATTPGAASVAPSSVGQSLPTGAGAGAPPSAHEASPTTPDLARLPRLWRRASDVRPATDVRTSVPAPVVRFVADPSRPAPAASPEIHRLPAAAGTAPAPAARATTTSSPITPTPTPTPTSTPAAGASTAPGAPSASPAAQVRRSSFPATRVGAHVASPGIAGAELAMPELMTIRRATRHGTDTNRTLATGFGAPQTIRPAGSPVAAPAAAVEGESRLWRRAASPAGVAPGAVAPVPTSARSTVGATARSAGGGSAPGSRFATGFATGLASAAAPAGAGTRSIPGPAARFAGPSPTTPVRRTWQPWNDAPASPGTPGTAAAAATTSFPAGPPGAASAPSGRRPAADVRRLTVAPPRISVAPSQPPPPPVPEVARTGNLPVPAPAQPPVRRSTGGSLIDATAHLFASPDVSIVRRSTDPGGPSVSASSEPPASGHLQIRRKDARPEPWGSASMTSDLGAESQETVNAISDDLVDKVVERIERRVIEELERRGRRHGRGGF